MHENPATPLSLSLEGKLHLGTKADHLDVEGNTIHRHTWYRCQMLDVQSWYSKNFSMFGPSVFSYVSFQIVESHFQARERKGHPKVSGSKYLNPQNCKDFLCVDENKTKLLNFFSQLAIRLAIVER